MNRTWLAFVICLLLPLSGISDVWYSTTGGKIYLGPTGLGYARGEPGSVVISSNNYELLEWVMEFPGTIVTNTAQSSEWNSMSGTISGATYVSDTNGLRAYWDFDGTSSDYVLGADHLAGQDVYAQTWVCVFHVDDTAIGVAKNPVFMFERDTGLASINGFNQIDDDLIYYADRSGSPHEQVNWLNEVREGEWYYVVGTTDFSDNESVLYVNGLPVGTNTTVTTIPYWQDDLRMARRSPASTAAWMDGGINYGAIYSNKWSATRVQADFVTNFNARRFLSDVWADPDVLGVTQYWEECVLSFTFDGQRQDQSPGRRLFTIPSAGTLINIGVSPQRGALWHNGSTDVMYTTNNTPPFNVSIAGCAWVRVDATNGNRIFWFYSDSSVEDHYMGVGIFAGFPGIVRRAGGAQDNLSAATPIGTNEWWHIGWNITSTSASVWTNGVLAATKISTVNYAGLDLMSVGAKRVSSGNSLFHSGALDEFHLVSTNGANINMYGPCFTNGLAEHPLP